MLHCDMHHVPESLLCIKGTGWNLFGILRNDMAAPVESAPVEKPVENTDKSSTGMSREDMMRVIIQQQKELEDSQADEAHMYSCKIS